MPTAQPPLLNVAIIGGGPGGLGAAIALSALPHISVTLYEQARELREIGAGIRIGANCWTVLGLLGAEDGVKGHVEERVLQRNGVSGELLAEKNLDGALSGGGSVKERSGVEPQRVRRTRLQSALVDRVGEGIIRLGRKLVRMEKVAEGKGVRLWFEDGGTEVADLVVGGDGIRSVVREHVFRDHSIKFTGTTIFRTLIPASSVSHIPDMTPATTWWHGPTGHMYSSLVDDPSELKPEEQMFEIAARNVCDPATVTGKRFSWGVPATKERVESFFTDYDPRVRETLATVPEGQWKEFSAFAGPRLEKLVAWEGRVVLIGDASHPLSGAFGSGAAFALEDGWILARAIEYARGDLQAALDIFDEIRSPYYYKMYQYLDQIKANMQNAKAANPTQSFEESLEARVNAFGGEDRLSWIYGNDIKEVWKKWVDGKIAAKNVK